MFDKLQGIEDKLEKINSSLCDPEVVSNQEEYKKLMREAKTLTPIVEKFREYKKANSDLTEAKEMLADSSLDKEFRDMASEEAAEAQKKGGEVAFVDAEHALDPTYAEALGVDINNLLVSQPDTGEQ